MKRALALAALLLAAPACHHDQNAVLLVVVTASGTPPAVSSLDVTLTSGRAPPSNNRYAHDGPDPIMFPTTLSAELPAYATGDITIDVRADDAAGAMVAAGHGGPVTIHPGERETVYVRLDCGGDTCAVDGGMGNDDGGMPPPNPSCGNGRVDRDETCDTKIPAGDPGACPATCDDHIACTTDTRSGSDCTVSCAHVEITLPSTGDECCPAGYSFDGPAADRDCSPSCGNGVVDEGETCDTHIPRGMVGACPTDCLPITCGEPLLVSFGTCSAVCTHTPIVAPSGATLDNCCPPGATYASDHDCLASCGNGVLDMGESCDVGIPAGAMGACPTSCDDGLDCTIDYFLTKGCQPACGHTPITTPISGDRCCPAGATNATDSDCPPVCGNNVVERGENCDGPSCPTTCPVPAPDIIGRAGCLINEVVGYAADCAAHCELTEITACNSAYKDGCCPEGCTKAEDPDCSMYCGDGVLQTKSGEVCETAAPPGVTGSCPTSCDDHNACTDDYLVSAGTCSARCVYVPVTAIRAGDGCCPKGANFYVDADCAPTCGDGVVERPLELCDYGTGAGCPSPDTCRSDDKCTEYEVQGRADTCSAVCVAKPVTECKPNDGCCAPGCTADDDSDCPPICGDGVVETSESCDRGITTGSPGACARTCDDGDACTFDQATGSVEGCSRSCSHAPITTCVSNDGCCPPACSPETDSDCAPKCGDKKIGAGETCDPPFSCPTTCPDDGDPCTAEQMTGAADTCTAACRHVPITSCSGTRADSCCPTGCTLASDTDC